MVHKSGTEDLDSQTCLHSLFSFASFKLPLQTTQHNTTQHCTENTTVQSRHLILNFHKIKIIKHLIIIIMGSNLSLLASVAILRNSFNELIPQELRTYLWEIRRRFSSEVSIVVKESHEGSSNHLYNALVTYLGFHAVASITASAAGPPRRLTAGKNESMKVLTYGLDQNSEIIDEFHGVQMKWGYYTDVNSTLHFEIRWYELKFHKKYSDLVKNKYLPYIIEMAKRIKDQNKVVKFYTTRGGREGWSSKGMNLDHPMTFDTLAMDGELKGKVIEDLDEFIRGKEYYKKIGKVWKRGYLLYGPPGTGKSSLIAAMANYLNYDIYNLNLSAVMSDSSLEHLLLHMSNRSLLVVEDIDCSAMLLNRVAADTCQQDQNTPSQMTRPQITLSGLLNAIDGLLSCCGDERIIVFTTNYKDRIDPALLRAGRMDMHIYLSYCTFSTFKQLAFNYLDIWDHHLFSSIEKLVGQVQVSPAEVAGELMKNRSPKTSLETLITFLENKKSEAKHGSPPAPEGMKTKLEHDGGADPVKGNVYKVKAEYESIQKSVLLKYGDIAANCSLQSVHCRSSCLEIVYGIIQRLQTTKLENLAQLDVKAMLSSVDDLQSVGLEVGWLRQRLDAIARGMSPDKNDIQQSKKTEENHETSDAETLKGLSGETETVTGTDRKLPSLHSKPLIDGLL